MSGDTNTRTTAALPARITAGDTLDLSFGLAAYPASAGWVLKMRLVPRVSGGSAAQLVSTPAGDNHRLQASAVTTAAWAAGVYGWAAWVELGAVQITVGTGETTVAADLRTAAAGVDIRSLAQRALDDALAALAAWTPTTKRWQIGDRTQEFASTADILAVVAYWQQQVRKEQRTAAALAGRPVARRTTLRIGR
jgi:hypothetical protein